MDAFVDAISPPKKAVFSSPPERDLEGKASIGRTEIGLFAGRSRYGVEGGARRSGGELDPLRARPAGDEARCAGRHRSRSATPPRTSSGIGNESA